MKVVQSRYFLRSLKNQPKPEVSTDDIDGMFLDDKWDDLKDQLTTALQSLSPSLWTFRPDDTFTKPKAPCKQSSSSQNHRDGPFVIPRTPTQTNRQSSLYQQCPSNVQQNLASPVLNLSTPPRPSTSQQNSFTPRTSKNPVQNGRKFVLPDSTLFSPPFIQYRPTRKHDYVLRTPMLPSGLCTPAILAGLNPLDALSTPALFPLNKSPADIAVPDILELIDGDSVSVETMEKQVHKFDKINLTDDVLAEYLLDIEEDYTKVPNKNTKHTVQQTMNIKKFQRPSNGQGAHTKQMSEVEEELIRKHQRQIYKEKKKARRKTFCGTTHNDEPKELRRKVMRHSRRTRSLVAACKQAGLADTEEEVDALFLKAVKCNEA